MICLARFAFPDEEKIPLDDIADIGQVAPGREVSDGRNPVTAYAHIRGTSRRPRAVDDPTAGENQIENRICTHKQTLYARCRHFHK